jgi:hypothetical protein
MVVAMAVWDNHYKLSRRAVGFRASVFRWLKQLEENGVDALPNG